MRLLWNPPVFDDMRSKESVRRSHRDIANGYRIGGFIPSETVHEIHGIGPLFKKGQLKGLKKPKVSCHDPLRYVSGLINPRCRCRVGFRHRHPPQSSQFFGPA